VKAYVIYLGDVLDAVRYEQYKENVAPNIVDAGGSYLVRGGDAHLLEGALPASRTVILEFPSREAALAWYEGDAYRDIKKLRDGAARASIYIVDGLE